MNIFENLFNKKQKDNGEKDKETNNLKIINELRENIDLIEKRNLFIEKHKDKLIIEAKAKLNNNDKKGALLILNKKKKIEEEINKNQGSQLLLENQLSNLESANLNKHIINSLSKSNKAIHSLNKDLNVDTIEELMDDIQEEQDNYNTIQSIMEQPLQQIYEDDDLNKELEELAEIKQIEQFTKIENSEELKVLKELEELEELEQIDKKVKIKKTNSNLLIPL
jgi:charged multivesicular body protein 4A/B